MPATMPCPLCDNLMVDISQSSSDAKILFDTTLALFCEYCRHIFNPTLDYKRIKYYLGLSLYDLEMMLEEKTYPPDESKLIRFALLQRS